MYFVSNVYGDEHGATSIDFCVVEITREYASLLLKRIWLLSRLKAEDSSVDRLQYWDASGASPSGMSVGVGVGVGVGVAVGVAVGVCVGVNTTQFGFTHRAFGTRVPVQVVTMSKQPTLLPPLVIWQQTPA